jgi:TatD DNase family protein
MVDSHCHLAGEEFAADLEAVVARAREAGLAGALCILSAGDAAEGARAEGVARLWPVVRFAAGIHPHHAGEFAGDIPGGVEVVRQSVKAHQACAIGEIGLDYHYDFSPKAVQLEVFAAQVRLARELRLPIVVHTREATDDTLRILGDEGGGEVRGVFHCFTGDRAAALRALESGFYLSFAGIVTFPRAEEVRDAARAVPADRILAETDAPYLAPVPYRGKRNEPAHVVRVVEALASLRGDTVQALGAQVVQNFTALFGEAPAAV